MGQNSSAHVARVVGLHTDAVVVTETRFRSDEGIGLKSEWKKTFSHWRKKFQINFLDTQKPHKEK